MSTRAHRAHINMLIGKLRRGHDLHIGQAGIERALGYPLAEATTAELGGVVAGLEAVLDAARQGVTR